MSHSIVDEFRLVSCHKWRNRIITRCSSNVNVTISVSKTLLQLDLVTSIQRVVQYCHLASPNLKNSHVSSNNFHVSICFHSPRKKLGYLRTWTPYVLPMRDSLVSKPQILYILHLWHPVSSPFTRFARKRPLVSSVCASVYLHVSNQFLLDGFWRNLILEIFMNESIEKIKVWLESDKNIGHSTWRPARNGFYCDFLSVSTI